MTNRIKLDPIQNTSKLYTAFVGTIMTALSEGRRVKKILDAAQYGAPADWPAVAAELGLVGPNANQQAQDAATILGNAMAKIDDPAIGELSRLDQG